MKNKGRGNQGMRPDTVKKWLRVHQLLKDNPELTQRQVCKRVGITPSWFAHLNHLLNEDGSLK